MSTSFEFIIQSPHLLYSFTASKQLKAVNSIYDIVNDYVQNNLPIYLIPLADLPQIKLYHRSTITRDVLPAIKAAIDSCGMKTDSPLLEREEKIREIVKTEVSFAICSHKWLREGELIFQDLHVTDPLLPGGPGHEKLGQFCELSKKYGCKYAWMDSACIDKRSSAELEESIRSMYHWYYNAKICIVHLGDTIHSEKIEDDVWFTRGWTLQELLAPPKMKFVNKYWIPLISVGDNDKDLGDHTRELLSKVSVITGIPVPHIVDFQPGRGNLPLRQVMVWASKRRTTRIEDIAYCLIGIFDIDLSIAYGEGQRAFYRLQAELVRQSDDRGLFLWEGKPSRMNSMFASGPECFLPAPSDTVALPPWFLDTAGDPTHTLTNRGLQIPMSLFDVLKFKEIGRDGVWIEFEVEVMILGKITLKVSEPLKFVEGSGPAYQVGIVGYQTTSSYVGKPLVVLLACHHTIVPPRYERVVTQRFIDAPYDDNCRWMGTQTKVVFVK